MKPGVIRSSRSASGARPSVRAKGVLAGLKLIVPPDLYGLQSLRRGAEETLGDVREALGRVRHVEVVEVVAQVARVRAGLAQVPQFLRRRAPQLFLVDQRLDGRGGRLARVDESHGLAHRLLNHAPQNRVVRAAED